MAYPTYGSPMYGAYPMHNQYPSPTQQPPAQNSGGFSCRPVTSREEATAVQVDFFGPGTIMPDLAHGVIYLKRFNNETGSCDMYEFMMQPKREERSMPYATREEIEQLRRELEMLRSERMKQDVE